MSEEQATFETRKDAGPGGQGAWRLWTAALDVAEKDEKDYREKARSAIDRYRAEKDGKKSVFNILYSSIQTQEPAVYNSTPIPDVRRRHGDDDPVGKVAAQVFERCLSYNMDEGNLDYGMEGVSHDALLPGRGVAHVVYEPILADGEVVSELVKLEHVQWDDFRRGPGKRWNDVPWIAVRYRITRDEAIALSPEHGRTVNLDHVDSDLAKEKDAKEVPDVFKRLTVWKIWDKSRREIVFLAPSFKEGLFATEPDTLNLKEFFPFPRPMYDVSSTTSLIPIVPFEMYRNQAEELDDLTRRIRALVKVLKWRGIRPSQIEELDRLAEADDGELIPSKSASTVMATAQAGGLDKMIWLMPIDRLITVIRELAVQREQVKQVVFEISGLADIMRGETNPNETLGAQQIKAQWGSMRMQRRQREVQRFSRDALRIMAEIIGEKFSVDSLAMCSGMKLPSAEEKAMAEQVKQTQPQLAAQAPPEMVEYLSQPSWAEVKAVMSSDSMRSYRVDIETDSTVQADQTRAQQNMSLFVEGTASFFAAVGPGVESGVFPMDVAVDIYTGMTRSFKLGKQVEDALERLAEQSRQGPQDDGQQQAQQMEAQLAQMQQALQEAQQQGQQLEQRAQAAEAAVQQAKVVAANKEAEIAQRDQDSQRRAEIARLETLRKERADREKTATENRRIDTDMVQHDDNIVLEAAKIDQQAEQAEEQVEEREEMPVG